MNLVKLMSLDQLNEAQAVDVWAGSDVDRADGFVHLSTTEQTPETARKWFADVQPVLAVVFAPDAMELVWEPSRGGALFPHSYVGLRLASSIETLHFETAEDAAIFFEGSL